MVFNNLHSMKENYNIKSYKRLLRREKLDSLYKSRIKLEMNKYGIDQMLHPTSQCIYDKYWSPVDYWQGRTKDWREMKDKSNWIHQLKNVRSKYKRNGWDWWNRKLKQHLEREAEKESIKEGIEEYNSNNEQD